MERQILFRGKRLDNKEWINGYLAYFFDSPKNSMIMPKCYFGTRDFGEEDNNGNPVIEDELALGGFINVIPDSVVQFTGLTDKNGVKAFDGDYIKDPKNYLRGIIIFDCGCFCVEITESNSQLWDKGQSPPLYEFPEFEVIGNIHDNPELLKQENQ